MMSQDFRAAMRRLPAGVSILSTMNGSEPVGMTVTSASSLSADPPSLLVCVNRSGSMHAAITEASHFAINILGRDHVDVARKFSDPAMREERFASEDWKTDDAGVPYFAPAQASFICLLVEQVHFGTHTICIGEVERIRLTDTDRPLIYFDGAYRDLLPA